MYVPYGANDVLHNYRHAKYILHYFNELLYIPFKKNILISSNFANGTLIYGYIVR